MHKKLLSNQLDPIHRRLTYGCFGVLLLSGLGWLYFHYFMAVTTDFGQTPHPAQTWWLKLHGLAAMAVLVIFGSLIPVHIRRAWHHRKNRGSGAVMVLIMFVLTLTGYGLYYIGGEELRPFISGAHWLLGSALMPIIVLHIALGRRARHREPKSG